MIAYGIVSVASGILFGILDGILNANPLARRMYAVYQPIARTSVNMLAGILIDLAYGFILAGAFLLLYNSLPGGSGLVKGLSFAGLAWFFRTVMYAASQWMMFKVHGKTVLYILASGLGEMVVLGVLYGLTLTPGA
jgi:hypothetical protein